MEEFAVSSGIRLGPPTTRLRAVARRGVPGPKELLSQDAPAASLYDALREDLRYLTADSWSGEVGQLLSAFSLLYLAQETQRIAIIPSIWRDTDHYGGSTVRMGDLFDLERFRKDTGTLFVEWSDVKPFRESPLSLKNDEIGCIFSWNSFGDGRSFGDYKVSSSAWSVQRPYGFAADSVEGHVLFDHDTSTRHELLQQAAIETERTLPRNLKEDQLMCYTNLWGLSKAGMSVPSPWWNTDYKDFDGLQSMQGGMTNVLHPALRGDHPEWWRVGQYLDFSPAVWEVAILAIRETLELDTRPLPNLLTMHIRRGDFASWCASGSGCVAPLESYKAAVDELLPELPEDTVVLVTTDDTSSEFHSSLRQLGWYAIDHSQAGTAALLKSRYGSSSGWWDSAVDAAIHSVGRGFVGTLDSQVSLVSALRVATWNDGPTRLVKRPH
ncbi:hypothetical protein JCM16303_005101 [Sporobolomyces ruberrimus]